MQSVGTDQASESDPDSTEILELSEKGFRMTHVCNKGSNGQSKQQSRRGE